MLERWPSNQASLRTYQNKLTLKEHFRRNINLAFPVAIGQLGHIMVVVADTIMVGQVGVIALASATFAGTFLNILMVFGIGVSYAITPMVAALKTDEVTLKSKYFHNALLLNFVTSLALFGFVFLLSFCLGFFGQEEAVATGARSYLLIVGGSLIPLMIFQTCRQYAEGMSNTFTPMLVSVIANLINIGLNYVLIYGKFGFPRMELEGAGYATLISRVIMALIILLFMSGFVKRIIWKTDWSVIRRMFKIGFPSGMQYVFETGAFATAAIMVGWMGADALAAHQIALNLAAVTYMIAIGVGSAGTIRIGNQMGLKDLPNLKLAGYTSLALIVAFMGFSGLIFINFRFELVALYIDELEVQHMAASLLVVAAAFQVSDGLQAVGLGILRGLTDVKVPTLVTFFAYWLVAIPVGYFLGFVMDMQILGIWYGLLIGLTLSAIMHIYRFRQLTQRITF